MKGTGVEKRELQAEGILWSEVLQWRGAWEVPAWSQGRARGNDTWWEAPEVGKGQMVQGHVGHGKYMGFILGETGSCSRV